jgi:hypothetical protein
LRLSKEQVTVVKTTLRSLNSTLLAVSENERILYKGLTEITKHIREHDSEIKELFSGTLLLAVGEKIRSCREPGVNVGESTIF